MYQSKKPYLYGTGRRKSSVARVRLFQNGLCFTFLLSLGKIGTSLFIAFGRENVNTILI